VTRLLQAAASWDEWAHRRGRKVGDPYAFIIDFYLRTGLRLEELRHLPVAHATAAIHMDAVC
jgi:hypothetical protein